jgi:hypothetical protein
MDGEWNQLGSYSVVGIGINEVGPLGLANRQSIKMKIQEATLT